MYLTATRLCVVILFPRIFEIMGFWLIIRLIIVRERMECIEDRKKVTICFGDITIVTSINYCYGGAALVDNLPLQLLGQGNTHILLRNTILYNYVKNVFIMFQRCLINSLYHFFNCI